MIQARSFWDLNKERCENRKTKECKRRDHKIQLVEEIQKNMRQPNFKALVLALYYYWGDNVSYGLLSENLFQREQQHGGWEHGVTINFYEKNDF